MLCKQCSKREVPAVRAHWATPVCFACVAPTMRERQQMAAQVVALEAEHKSLLHKRDALLVEVSCLELHAAEIRERLGKEHG